MCAFLSSFSPVYSLICLYNDLLLFPIFEYFYVCIFSTQKNTRASKIPPLIVFIRLRFLTQSWYGFDLLRPPTSFALPPHHLPSADSPCCPPSAPTSADLISSQSSPLSHSLADGRRHPSTCCHPKDVWESSHTPPHTHTFKQLLSINNPLGVFFHINRAATLDKHLCPPHTCNRLRVGHIGYIGCV